MQGEGEDLERTIASVLQNEPRLLILVTLDDNLSKAEETIRKIPARQYGRVQCLSNRIPNKRQMIARGYSEVTTEITVFAEDDVTWASNTLRLMLAPFEDKRYGAVLPCQRNRRPEHPNFTQRLYSLLGALYLQRYNFDCTATTQIDRSVPFLSTRTCACRTSILQDVNFTNQFINERWWFGEYQLNTDEDYFLIRWMVAHSHDVYFQNHPCCEIQTSLEDNSNFLLQCVRWARSDWRSTLTDVLTERHVWRYLILLL